MQHYVDMNTDELQQDQDELDFGALTLEWRDSMLTA